MHRTRRRVLATLGTTGTALLAGCSDRSDDTESTESPSPTATDPPESRFVTEDLVVDYPGMIDGAATVEVGERATTIRYEDPPRTFRLLDGFEGDTDRDELRVDRDLSGDARAGFVAPIHDVETSTFAYQAFANEAFVEYTDWNFVSVDASGSLRQEGTVPFERAQGRVFAAGVRPGRIRQLFVVDRTAARIREEGAGDLSGIVVLVEASDTATHMPTPTPTA